MSLLASASVPTATSVPDAISAVAACVAALAALLTVIFTRQAVKATRAAVTVGAESLDVARADGRTADLRRRRERLIQVGQLVEDVFATAVFESNYSRSETLAYEQWMTPRNQLRHLLGVDLRAELPRCARILDASSAAAALAAATDGRVEIENALEMLYQAETKPSPKTPAERRDS